MELPEHKTKNLTDVEKAIGKLIAENLVEDGATMQMGIGAIPDAVLADLTNHKDLGVHSEMFSDGVVDLYNLGLFLFSVRSSRYSIKISILLVHLLNYFSNKFMFD
jgi:acyl-CoA hydrolase